MENQVLRRSARTQSKLDEVKMEVSATSAPKKKMKVSDSGSKALDGKKNKKSSLEDDEDDDETVKKGSKRMKKEVKNECPSANGTASCQAKDSNKRGRKIKVELLEEEEELSLPKKSDEETVKKGKTRTKKEPKNEFPTANGIASGQSKVTNKRSKKIKVEPVEEEVKAPKKSAIDRSVVKKGKAPVDGLCPIVATSHIFYDDEDIWDCMLNQTNIQFNNNKYYLIQLLKDDCKNVYSVWMRWGRVGCNGQNSLQPCGSNLDKAKNIFMKKFSDKTKNSWDSRDEFEKVPGKYDLLKMDYDDKTNHKDEVDAGAIQEDIKNINKVECKLHINVRALIELICDIKAMEEAVIEMKYDAKKAPLGKLTADQVKAGFLALKQIEDIIGGSGKTSNRDLLQACNDFYTRIPHYFGMKVPPMIRTRTDVLEKMALLESLSDIQAAMTILGRPKNDALHPTDQHYHGLQCDIESIAHGETEYKLLEKYLVTTHGKTHNFFKMEVSEIFRVKKHSEDKRFNDLGNRMLLWHGSRLTNWAGILGTGLRIAPPESPSTGYMFGKGIYFADMSSKSANYCMATSRNNTGLLVLCDVALGSCNELINADYRADKLPKGCHSVKGVGKTAPTPKNYVKMDDGVVLPMGPGVDSTINNNKGYTLQYNEYIVYDVSQVQLKYLFKVNFKF